MTEVTCTLQATFEPVFELTLSSSRPTRRKITYLPQQIMKQKRYQKRLPFQLINQ